jgi:hypothetical protein
MAVARFKKICLDADQPLTAGPFWAEILGLSWQPDTKGEGGLYDGGGRCIVWVNQVPRVNPVKRRVHLDMYAPALGPLLTLGCRIVLFEGDDRRWTVLADPEGKEFCAFLRPDPPTETLHGLVIDSADPAAQAHWWGNVYGGTVTDSEAGFSTSEIRPEQRSLGRCRRRGGAERGWCNHAPGAGRRRLVACHG